MDLTWNDNESDRIENLHSYEIMDTDPETTFDQLTFLAAKACNKPISLLSFINTERQWFKSTYGLEIQEIPKHVSACNQTIRQDGIYEIKDATENNCPYSKFMLNNGFRYYAGVPITSKEGHNMGSLCVIDYKPGYLSREQAHVLKVISSQVVDLMDLRKEYSKNLQELQRIGEVTFKRQGHLQDVAHKASIRAMAELSTGLIYRIRPLAGSLLKAGERIKTEKCRDEDLDLELDVLKQSSESILSILSSLERFIAAEKEKWMKPMDLSEVIKGVINHLEYKVKHFDIHLSINLEQNLICIGNISQISEAVFAVINNAIEATKNLKEKSIGVTLKEENHQAIMTVTDSGKGIQENIRPFIFQPFFTTKNDRNLGVGLSLAQALIQRHNGEIELEKPYGPTTFRITLPVP